MLLGRVVQNSKISVRVDLYPKSYITNISANTQQSSDTVCRLSLPGIQLAWYVGKF